jgi:hypothetical protein
VTFSWLASAAIALSAVSAIFIVGFWIKSPPLTGAVKLLLLFTMLVLPTSAAMIGNVSNLEATKTVSFCNQCHVMNSYVDDVRDPNSPLLASRHARLPAFKDDACYVCHADYGMYGGVTTKIGGMHHVVAFYSDDWSEPGHRPPALYKPYDLRTCLECHDPLKADAPLEHRVHADKIRELSLSCVASGCHGHPHPPWKQVQP